jgi:hypothetical protein
VLAASSAGSLASYWSHTVSAPGVPRSARLVPPTAVTNGWLAGSSTASAWDPLPPTLQAEDPESPDAASTVSPWLAASSKSVFSVAMRPASYFSVLDSHRPQEVEMT